MINPLFTIAANIVLAAMKKNPENQNFRRLRRKDRWAGRQHRRIMKALKKLSKQDYTNEQKRVIFSLSFPDATKEITKIIFP